ncbi:MAG: ComF family protein [Candidatus Electrothrix sp. GW3-4]|uniref:ComF family protein n=1 Tax=Candidatus Electrothrix sp. GW3-4 TaxID=3126740 RepID=UPI0030D3E991
MSFLHKGIQALQELLFPARCLGCEEQLASSRPPLLCSDCLKGATTLPPPFCTCCGTPLPFGDNHLCLSCLEEPLALTRARSSFLYQEPISTLVRQLKFNGNLTGLASLAALVQETAAFADLNPPDLILPVPLHIQRLRERGFNQSLLLARACFPEWQQRIRFDLLKRRRPTVPQTRLSGKARRHNLHKAFCVQQPHTVQGKHILLVDDVLTTGSTLHECAKVLLEAEATEVETFTVARSGAAGTGGRSVSQR